MADRPLSVLLVDPSLFTGPYDGALDEGLRSQGVATTWAVRPVRPGDRDEIPAAHCDPFFYRRVDAATGLPGPLRAVAKGLAHAGGMLRLTWRAWQRRHDVVHFQWVVVPPIDALAMWVLRRFCTVVLTVHDTVPFNGERISLLQNLGFDLPIRLAHRVIVHTQAGRATLLARGIGADRVEVVPHGPLKLHAEPALVLPQRDPRYAITLFGEIKPYKGLDLLIAAVASLPAPVRAGMKLVVAGRPRMEMAPLLDEVARAGLGEVFEFRLQRLSEQEMADLFAATDAFVFPYRQIDASGVYFLVKGRGRWLIASRVGVFAEDLAEGDAGRLCPPEDVPALAAALAEAVGGRLRARADSADGSWRAIGERTRQVYAQAIAARRGLHAA